jgi:hypothetical protein
MTPQYSIAVLNQGQMYTLVLAALKPPVILKGDHTETTKRSPMDIVNNTQCIPLSAYSFSSYRLLYDTFSI